MFETSTRDCCRCLPCAVTLLDAHPGSIYDAAMRKALSPYVNIARTAFLSEIAFRWNVVFQIVGSVLLVFIQVALWSALYSGRASVEGISLNELASYFVLSAFLRSLYHFNIGGRLADGISSGTISLELIRPMSVKVLYASQNAGEMAAGVLFQSVPMLIVVALLFHLQGSASLFSLIVALAAFILGFVISAYLEIIAGLLAFWLLGSWYLSWYLAALSTLFSGSLVPLWFYPRWLGTIASFLPFRFTFFEPLSLYLGRTPVGEYHWLLIFSCLWIAVLVAVEKVIWRIGMRRIVVHGG